jgi:hypothetical protein
VSECDREASIMRRGCCTTGKEKSIIPAPTRVTITRSRDKPDTEGKVSVRADLQDLAIQLAVEVFKQCCRPSRSLELSLKGKVRLRFVSLKPAFIACCLPRAAPCSECGRSLAFSYRWVGRRGRAEFPV